jgi:hypothetical protein
MTSSITSRFLVTALLVLGLALFAGFPLGADAQGGTPGGGSPTGTPGGGNPGGTPGGGDPPGTPGGGSPNTVGTGLQNPLKNINSLGELVNAILAAVVKIGGIVLVLALVYVGFLFVAAQGNEEKIRNARSALMWTVIGGLILLGATAISAVITATVGGLTG